MQDGKAVFYGVEAAQKAPLWLRITATGAPGHAAYPEPTTAVTKLVGALHKVIRRPSPLTVVPHVQRFFAERAVIEPPAVAARYRDLASSLRDPAFGAEFDASGKGVYVRTTVAVTMLAGGAKENVIPPEASAVLDVRLLPGDSPDAFVGDLKKLIDDPAIKIDVLLSWPPTTTPLDREPIRILRELAAEEDPGVPVLSPLLVGFSDCHHFREHGIDCFGFTPNKLSDADMAGVHGHDERIPVEVFRDGVRRLYTLVERLAGAGRTRRRP
jgi:acetylornithine deacetylase/succinyl-diaminopimelate desuccinylase-like protein